MTDEIDILEQTISEYRDAKRIKNMNQELLHHLGDSIFYLLRHAERYNLNLPKKERLERMVEKANFLINEITDQPQSNINNNYREGNSTCFSK